MPVPRDPSRELGFGADRPRQNLFHRWVDGHPEAPPIRFGVVTAINVDPDATNKIVGTVDVVCTDGTAEKNCEVLTDPADWSSGAGEEKRPFLGSRCVILAGPGGEAWAVGFTRPITSGFTADDGRDKRTLSREESSPGDWVRRSKSGAKIVLHSGGIIQLFSTPACLFQLNPATGEAIMNGQVLRSAADGYKMRRGRLPGVGLSPNNKTLSREVFMDRATASAATHWIEDTGAAGSAAKPALRQVTIKQSGTLDLGREYYTSSAGFVGQMKSYHYGAPGAGENFVLGQVLKGILKDFLKDYLVHQHGTPFGPSSPPVDPSTATTLLASKIEPELFLSSFMFTQKLPSL